MLLASIEPYLADGPPSYNWVWGLWVPLAIIVGGTIFAFLIEVEEMTAFFIFIALGFVLFNTLLPPSWNEHTAAELQERYGVTISAEELEEGGVRARTEHPSPSSLKLSGSLENSENLRRDTKSGEFIIGEQEEVTDLYLLIDGKVLEVMKKADGRFVPLYATPTPPTEKPTSPTTEKVDR